MPAALDRKSVYPLDLIVEIVGWMGASLILLAYCLLSIGKMQATSPAYQWLNIGGAVGFIVNSGWNGAMPSVALNIIWFGIGITALWKLKRNGVSSI
ncbi:CBU_0592 family membrane protein [Erythrobacter mangrovi]|uniref:CBU-0592-like domain-containing protein n=1 Tax=Erythrobacter mangrovi TaxID=2739433 RepID=A0A7D4CLI7_9SPHN|nr:hypothetical protein [Erythrobacter mangrovi]QKG70628.1 hypothetical protein HQR01_04160 [Erythrobacter mangrovi]